MNKNDSHSSFVKIAIFVIGAVILLGAFLNGDITYALKFLQCGKAPITASDFAASFSYYRPGDEGYGPSFLSDHFYCSEKEAINAGYRLSVFAK